jgi:hypothetical protein
MNWQDYGRQWEARLYREASEHEEEKDMEMDELIKCPFCGEDDFDLWGLKYHLARYCGAYEKIDLALLKDDDELCGEIRDCGDK